MEILGAVLEGLLIVVVTVLVILCGWVIIDTLTHDLFEEENKDDE